MREPLPPEFWRVYNSIARQWYETEYGKVAVKDRWYHLTMLKLEAITHEHKKNEAEP